MFPITLDVTQVRIALVGNGPAAVRRLAQLDEAKAQYVTVYSTEPSVVLEQAARKRLQRLLPDKIVLQSIHILMVADLESTQAHALAALARDNGVLVNVEDDKPHCDFHFPSFFRRGDLLFSISSGGKSPSLTKAVATSLAEQFGPEWEERMQDVAELRNRWRSEGRSMSEVSRQTAEYLRERGWLDHSETEKA